MAQYGHLTTLDAAECRLLLGTRTFGRVGWNSASGVQILPVPLSIPAADVRQFWHRRSHTDPAVSWLRRLVAECFIGRDPTQARDSVFWSDYSE